MQYFVEHLTVVNKQHSHIAVFLVQLGKGSVECNRDWRGMQIGVGLGVLG